MKKFEITEELLNQVFLYLIDRPFKEVEPLVGGLREVVKHEIVEPSLPPEVKDSKKK